MLLTPLKSALQRSKTEGGRAETMPAKGEVETSLSSHPGKGLCQSTGSWAREEQVTSPYLGICSLQLRRHQT